MIHRRWGALLAACILGVCSTARAQQPPPKPPPLSAFGQLPNVSDMTLSPSGDRFALVVRTGDSRLIQVHDLATLKPLTTANIGDIKVRRLQWVGPTHLVIVYSSTGLADGILGKEREWYQAIVLNVATGRVTRVLDTIENALNTLADMPVPVMVDGHPVLMIQGFYFAASTGTLSLFRTDLSNGQTKLLLTGNEHTNDWVVDPAGKPIGRVDYDQKTGRWELFLFRDGRWRSAYVETAPIDVPGVVGLGRDGASVMIRSRIDGKSTVREIALADGAVSEPIEALRFGSLLKDPRTLRPYGRFETNELSSRYEFFDPAEQRFWDGLAKLFAGENVELASTSDDRSKLLLLVTGERDGYSYHLVDVKKRSSDWVADVYDAIPPGATAQVRSIEYEAADGTTIPAYLTIPRGRGDKKLPLVVLVHGGPASRDEPTFDWWSQALASRGYAVLQPQFRGSSGFEAEFMTAGYGEWGRKMQTDVSDGVASLARDGTIDPARVCIVGASYGGYAALAGVALQKDLYRCAVSIAGPSDLEKMLRDIKANPGRQDVTLRYWDRFMGASDSRLDAISPALHADAVSSPVLIIHGNDDTVVPIEQSRRMTEALKRAGRKVEMITLKGEDHWLSRGDTRLQMLEATAAFLAANNPADAPAAVAAK